MNTRNKDNNGLRYGSQYFLPLQGSGRSCHQMIRRTAVLLAFVAAPISQPTCAIDITDQRGQNVAFEKPPQRVVFLPIPGPATFIAIDSSERKIVGMNAYSASAMREGLLGKMFPGVALISTNVWWAQAVPPTSIQMSKAFSRCSPMSSFSGRVQRSTFWTAPAFRCSACAPDRKRILLASSG